MVNVDNPLGIRFHEIRRENLHVAREDDEVHGLALEESQNLAFGGGFVFLTNRHEIKGNAVEICDRLAVGMIGDTAGKIAVQFA